MNKPEKIRCDACPVMCYIADGKIGACDRYANEGGKISRCDGGLMSFLRILVSSVGVCVIPVCGLR